MEPIDPVEEKWRVPSAERQGTPERAPRALRARRRRLTTGLVLGLFLAALEAGVVAPVMPTIVRDLGGARLYGLPFAIYLLLATVSAPLWGRASDRYGRLRLYQTGVALFLTGSALCGAARTMGALVLGRAVQGLGAGALQPLTFTLIGELYPLAERARVQGFISAVWGLSGLLGPTLGGALVQWASWRWVFYLNLPFGLLAAALVGLRRDPAPGAAPVDLAGALAFTAASTALLLGLELRYPTWTAVGLLGLGVALREQWRSPHPLVPLRHLRAGLPHVALAGNLLAGAAYFGSVAYVPLFAQAKGASPAASGLLLTPLIVGWTGASIVASRLLPRVGVGRLALGGFALLSLGFLALALTAPAPLGWAVPAGLAVGVGMGFAMLSLFVGAQEVTGRAALGAVTAGLLFARSLGGAVGLAAFGALLGDAVVRGGPALVAGLTCVFAAGAGLAALAGWLARGLLRRSVTSPATHRRPPQRS